MRFYYCRAVRLQDGATELGRSEEIYGVATGGSGSVVLAGATDGWWSGSNAGDADFAAVTLDENGTEIWRWQVTGRLLRLQE